MEETSEEFIRLNTEQMYAGKDSAGREMSPQYASQGYADEKHGMNPTPGYGTPDLKYSGAFYQGYELEVQGDKVKEDSRVQYAGKLTAKYGEQIWGLDPENLSIYRQETLVPLMRYKVEIKLFR